MAKKNVIYSSDQKFLAKGDKIEYIKPDLEIREGLVTNVFLVDGKYEYFVIGNERDEIVRCYQIAKLNGRRFIDRTGSITSKEETIYTGAIFFAYGFSESNYTVNENEKNKESWKFMVNGIKNNLLKQKTI